MQPTKHIIFILQIRLLCSYYLFCPYRPPTGRHSRYCWNDPKYWRPFYYSKNSNTTRQHLYWN